MAMIPNWTPESVRNMVNVHLERVRAAVIVRLQKIGETFITNARENGNYRDRTGNLRNSIGYIILENGVQIDHNFPGGTEPTALDPNTEKEIALRGVETGQEVADEVATKYPLGLVLICVAGMEYAAAVESKGYDVISASGIQAKNDLQVSINQLQAKLSR